MSVESRSQLEVAPESVAESNEEAKLKPENSPETKKKEKSYLDEFLKLLSSVKFGLFLLCLLMVFSMIGTFVVQQGTSDFAKFFESLTPAEKKLYEALGFFDIYHVWYFNLLLLTLALNIVLATIDRAPGHWHFFSQPKSSVSESYVRHQSFHTHYKLPASAYTPDFVKKLAEKCGTEMLPRWLKIFGPLGAVLARLSSFRLRVTEAKDGSTTIFIERGVWNRFAFCAVHVALLMILIGWFVGNKWGQKGIINFAPGEVASQFFSQNPDNSVKTFELPFRMHCKDIQQELIDSSKPDMTPSNTLDWHTRVIFEEGQAKFEGDVHLNEPVDFRGYRFFQASFDPINSARNLTLTLTPDGGGQAQEVTLKRNGSAEVPGLGKIRWREFYPHFTVDPKTQKADTASGEYVMPVAEVDVLLSDGNTKTVLAFTNEMFQQFKESGQFPPFLTDKVRVSNFTVTIKEFEKVSRAHTLQVQYDPGVDTIYWGCGLLVLFLLCVFFFAHERVWVLVKPGQNDLHLYFAGNTNRNRPAFEIRYNSLLALFQESFKDVKIQKVEK